MNLTLSTYTLLVFVREATPFLAGTRPKWNLGDDSLKGRGVVVMCREVNPWSPVGLRRTVGSMTLELWQKFFFGSNIKVSWITW